MTDEHTRTCRKNLTLVLNSLRVGGSQSVALTLATWAVRRGWDVTVASRGGELEPQFRAAGVRLLTLIMREGTASHQSGFRGAVLSGVKTLATCVGAIQLTVHCLRRPGVLHASQPWPVAISALASWLSGAPLVWHAHGTSDVEMPPAWPRLVNRRVKRYVAISPEVERALLSLAPHAEDVVCLTTPVTPMTAMRTGDKRADLTVATMSTLTANKLEYVLATMHAAAMVLDRFPRVDVMVVGDGPCRSRIEEEANALRASHPGLSIHLVGQQVGCSPTLSGADVIVGMGLVALEASMAGLSVVCASSEGLGGHLTVESYERLHARNFTGRGGDPLSPQALADEIIVAATAQDAQGRLQARLNDERGTRAAVAFDRLWSDLIGGAAYGS